jgi:hypothetical protein
MESEWGSSFCLDAFSSREPVPTSLENALIASARQESLPRTHQAVCASRQTTFVFQGPRCVQSLASFNR